MTDPVVDILRRHAKHDADWILFRDFAIPIHIQVTRALRPLRRRLLWSPLVTILTAADLDAITHREGVLDR